MPWLKRERLPMVADGSTESRVTLDDCFGPSPKNNNLGLSLMAFNA
jgi:hypothetical protein